MNESEHNTNQCIDLKQAADLFDTNPLYPQTLARLYYIEVKEDNKYQEAKEWAERAIKRDPKISHIRHTLGQVHKNHLLNEVKNTFSDIDVCLAIAQSAIKAFEAVDEAAEDEAEDNTEFNNRGIFGFLQLCKIIDPTMPFHQYINSLKCDVETKKWYLAFSRPNSRGLMDRALDLKPEVTQGCGFEFRL